MLTRQEEEIAILESEEKNTRLFIEWLIGKEGKRDGSNSKRGQQEAPEGSVSPQEATAQNAAI